MKKKFETPRVVREVRLQLETNFLNASIVDEMTVISTGQAVEDYDFSDDTFNHEWKWGEEN